MAMNPASNQQYPKFPYLIDNLKEMAEDKEGRLSRSDHIAIQAALKAIQERDEKVSVYEKSFASMWEQISALRRERDQTKLEADRVHDLLLYLERDINAGALLSAQTIDAFNAAKARMK